MHIFGKEWYVTNGGSKISLGKSNYKFFLMMPTENYKELFNIEQEIVVLFSDYDTFEQRTLDGFERVYNSFNELRIEKVKKKEESPSEWIRNISQIFYESWKISKSWLQLIKNSLSKVIDNKLLTMLNSY